MPEISVAVRQCADFNNNTRLFCERAIKKIARSLVTAENPAIVVNLCKEMVLNVMLISNLLDV